MKHTLFLIVTFSFLFFNHSYGQIKDFKKYQSAINNAELNLIKNNKQEALNIYYKVLLNSDGNFSKDVYNALILSKELNKVDTFFIFFDLLKFKNYNNDYLNGLTEFQEFHKFPKWGSFLKINNQKIYIDTALKSVLNNLHSNDQLFRTKEGSYSLYGDTINKIDSLNIITLLKIISKQGLPGEKEVGARSLTGDQGYDIVLHHHSQSKSTNKNLINLTPILIKEAQAGRIEPNKCAHYLEMQNDGFKAGVFDIYSVRFGAKQSSYLVPIYSAMQKVEIDNYRNQLFLEPLEDYYEKVKFFTRNPNSKYKFDILLNVFEVDNDKMYNAMVKSGAELK